MNDIVDFSECEFIEKEMKFYFYDDFCIHKELIKRRFDKLSNNGKIFYKYYVYANTHMSLVCKNKIWDYLNGYSNELK